MNLKHIRLAKKAVSSALAAAILLTSAGCFASVLGSSRINGYTTQIGEGTYYTHNVFFSDQGGVGQQTENYITYTPNSSVTPSITNGTALYGTSTVSKELNRLDSLGLNIIGGSNADYFSLQTGVPMSNAIVDGKILTKDATGQDGIGILPDGTAFISYFSLNSVLTKADGTEVNIYNINKYRQPYAAYMMTEAFSSETHNTTKGIDIILGSVEGEMRLGTKLTAVVEAINETEGSAPIPKGKIILTIDKKAPEEFLAPLSSLTVGEKVSIGFSANGDSRWSKVVTGMGSVGGRLLINGEVNQSLAQGAAPRTAIGIKDDGSIVLYTIDGRQNGYSYGVQLKTLAKRMQELGCTEAINLDGGGSTQIAVQLPGNSSPETVNRPSDGKERGVSTFLFFANTAKKSGNAELLHLYPKDVYILTGASVPIEIKATDAGYYPAPLPSDIEYSVEDGKNSVISPTGLFTARDNGAVTVYAESGSAKGSVTVTCLATPTDLKIKNADGSKEIKSLSLNPNDKILLSAHAYGGYNKLISSAESFVWEADSEIGTISDKGEFTASDKLGSKGNIRISAGEKTVTVPVTIAEPSADDPNAYPQIELSLKDGILNGRISCIYNIGTEKDDIIIKADGKAIDFEYSKETGEFFAEGLSYAGKITVYAANSFGYTSFASVVSETVALPPAPFTDTNGHWAENILGYMYSQKIINGDSTGGTLVFNPQKAMTRSEFAVMISNFLKLELSDYDSVALPYNDLEKIPFWALSAFKALYKEGIIKGRYVSETESCADPLASISRAEAATIVTRILPQGIFKTKLDAPDISEVPLWAADGINTLVTLGAVKGYEDGTLKPLNTLTKAEAAKILYSVM